MGHGTTRYPTKNNYHGLGESRHSSSSNKTDGTELLQKRVDGYGQAYVKNNYYGLGESRHTSSSNKTDYYYTLDHLGSIREMLNSSGTIQAAYDYTPYGSRTKVGGALDVDRGYTGHWHHDESGLIIAPFRFYDATLGRWVSTDPIGEAGGINLYGYVSNRPVYTTDPLGLFDKWDAAQGVADFISGVGDTVTAGGTEMTRSWLCEIPWFDGEDYSEPVSPTAHNIGKGAGFLVGWGGAAKALVGRSVTRMRQLGAQGKTLVTHWGSSTISSGSWVMRGGPSISNYLRSFKWQPKMGNQFASPGQWVTKIVDSAEVVWPKGWSIIEGKWKGLFGQRRIK